MATSGGDAQCHLAELVFGWQLAKPSCMEALFESPFASRLHACLCRIRHEMHTQQWRGGRHRG